MTICRIGDVIMIGWGLLFFQGCACLATFVWVVPACVRSIENGFGLNRQAGTILRMVLSVTMALFIGMICCCCCFCGCKRRRSDADISMNTAVNGKVVHSPRTTRTTEAAEESRRAAATRADKQHEDFHHIGENECGQEVRRDWEVLEENYLEDVNEQDVNIIEGVQ